ncbi:hypothetical protein COY87_00825 [Candidatus Roizmanbacteria bacterium CG_4_10_14_0_8_um_filter_33_9]|uniref:Uncharacterized protein n=1 Tax=Candidatus Roizmanbacteria bacterium CG_4_10_14_0_8_um_filter_33_9 TaxID=1974826 RepID=A0A2M7QKJ0_9BACT|nr:MAG: hypothetical protein COY87_00825 [Candidatus Roizmanbacteria bacterium CG_4_10_14_0_8_um_filter_33_9]
MISEHRLYSEREEEVRSNYLSLNRPINQQADKLSKTIDFAYNMLRAYYHLAGNRFPYYDGSPRKIPSDLLLKEKVVPPQVENVLKEATFRKASRSKPTPEYATVWVEIDENSNPDNPNFILHTTYLKRIRGISGMHQFIKDIPNPEERLMISQYFPEEFSSLDQTRYDLVTEEEWEIGPDGHICEKHTSIVGFHTHLGPNTAALPQKDFPKPILLRVSNELSARAINRMLLFSACATSLFTGNHNLHLKQA